MGIALQRTIIALDGTSENKGERVEKEYAYMNFATCDETDKCIMADSSVFQRHNQSLFENGSNECRNFSENHKTKY